MEAYLASLSFMTVSGFTFYPSLHHLFLILVFLVCTGLVVFCGVLLGRACPCLYFGLFCAVLSMKNLLPIFTGAAMWIPILVFPGCFGAIGLYLLISFVMWLVDADRMEMSDQTKFLVAVLTIGMGIAALDVFLYVFVTHSILIILLVTGSLSVLGILNQKKLIANGHRFKTYTDLYEIKIDEYQMQTQKDIEQTLKGGAKPAAAEASREKKKRKKRGKFLTGKEGGTKNA